MNIALILSVCVNFGGWLALAFMLFRKAQRVGYLEGRLAEYEDDDTDWVPPASSMFFSGPTSMAMGFTVASHADVFGGMGASGPAHPHPPYTPPIAGDGWNNYVAGTGMDGVWAQRDRDRREGRR